MLRTVPVDHTLRPGALGGGIQSKVTIVTLIQKTLFFT